MENIAIDVVDGKLIYLLGKNSRTSYTALAKTLRTSREMVAFRVERLKKRGVIRGCTANVNFHRFGKYSFHILVKTQGMKHAEQAESFLNAHPKITSVQLVFGRWDYIILARTSTLEEFSTLIDEMLASLPMLAEVRHSLILDEVGPGWGVLIPARHPLPSLPKDRIAFTSEFSHRAKSGQAMIDDIDELLLLALGEDARTSILQLADKTGITYRTAQRRIARLIEDGVIESFDIRGSLTPLGFSRRTVLVKAVNVSKNASRIRTFLCSLRECSRYWQLLGENQLAINIYTKSTADFQGTLRKLQDFFGEDLRGIESVDVLEQKKRIGYPSLLAGKS